MFFEFKSKFVKRYCEAGILIENALKEYSAEVRSGQFPSKENFYNLDEGELEKMLADPKWKYIVNKIE
jgi:3-methyl-2-oxobutanoate hydroxymethyltransferase